MKTTRPLPKIRRRRSACFIGSMLTKGQRRGIGLGNGGLMLDPLGGTDAVPGSPEKVCVIEDRARRGVALFHPLDLKLKSARTDEIVRALEPLKSGHHKGDDSDEDDAAEPP